MPTFIPLWKYETVGELVRAAAASDLSVEQAAEAVVEALDEEDSRRMLLCLMGDLIEDERRARVREIERDAEWKAEREEREARRALGYHVLDASDPDNPLKWRRNSKRYKEWARTPEGEAVERDRRDSMEREIARWAEIDDHGGPLGHATWLLDRLIEKERRNAKLELTEELLGSSFALGDGTMVTWGSATAEEHQQRILMLMRNVEGNLTTISIHQKALAMMSGANAGCLSEVARLGAPSENPVPSGHGGSTPSRPTKAGVV